MPNVVRNPYSNTAGNTPSSLGNGVIAVNQADGKLFYRSSAGVVTALATSGGGATEVYEYATTANFPATGSAAQLVIATDTGRVYRWAGNAYAELGPVGGSVADTRWDLLLPPAPTGLTVTGGNAQATLSWTAPTGVLAQAPVSDYVVQFSADGGTTWTTVSAAASTATTTTLTGLTNGQAVKFRVAAVNGVGVGAYTSASTAITLGTPAAPTGLAATSGNAQVSLTWTAPSNNGGSSITDYSVQFSSNSGSTWTNVSRTASTTASQVVSGLANGTAYVFRVAGINSNGTGTYTAASSSVTPSSVALSVSPATIIGSTPLPGVSYTFSGAGTAGDKLTSGATTYRNGGNRFDAAAYQSHAFTCGVSGTLYFEWGPGGADDDGLYWASLTSYRRNGTVSTTFATAQLAGTAPFVGEGQQRRGISVSAGDVINLQQFVIERPGTPLRAWIE